MARQQMSKLLIKYIRRLGAASDPRKKKLPGFLQRLKRELARNGGETFQELIEAISAFQVIEQSLHGNARSTEYGYTVHDFGIASDGLSHLSYCRRAFDHVFTLH
jgi:hypothetical protein